MADSQRLWESVGPKLFEQAPCAINLHGIECTNAVYTHFNRPEEQDWQYCDSCYDSIQSGDTTVPLPRGSEDEAEQKQISTAA